MNKENNMTFEELVNLPRVNRNGGVSLLGLWNDANESGDTEMVELTMSAMAEQNRIKGLNFKPPGQFPKPMTTGTPGLARELLRKIDLREKG